MNLKLIKKLCGLQKPQIERVISKYLFSIGYKKVYRKDDYILAEGDLPICLLAHMDTVFAYTQDPEDFFYDPVKKVLWAPGGSGFDDRAGIYAILQILNSDYKPHLIFTDKEEVGGLGAREVIRDFPACPFKECHCLIQLDRAHKDDAVYYNCDNPDFEKYINSFGFVTDWGTFTDISVIAPEWEIAAVNLSIGYEDEHTQIERLHTDWCDDTIRKVKKILNKSREMMDYAYIPVYYGIGGLSRYGYEMDILNDLNGDTSAFGTVASPALMQPKSQMGDIQTPEFTDCLLCGTTTNYPRHGVRIDDPDYPYVVCDECFVKYYDEKGNYVYSQISPSDAD